jgi:nickel/cobalt transporter (NiCoT) family protein
MHKFLDSFFHGGTVHFGGRIVGILLGLVAFNILAWAWAFVAFRDHPILLGTALLAYTFGLRHAVDADHIAAIDNITRKLMRDSKRPVAIGLYFSLGHSTIVVLTSAALALTTTTLQVKFASFKEVSVVIVTGVSALSLFAVALTNVVILISVYRTFGAVRRGESLVDDKLDTLLAQRGGLGRWVRPLFKFISKSWHMYPLGVLFGLGFDTATEIGLLGISAIEATHLLPLWSIMVFPALFTAGMSLIDTADAVLMLGVYGWAMIKPIRKLYYNLVITFASVLIAVLIGGAEVLGLLASKLRLDGGFWRLIEDGLNNNFGTIGYLIVAAFAVSWLVSVGIYRLNRYDEIEVDRSAAIPLSLPMAPSR